MRIGIDIDDTITDTYNALLPYAQKYTIDVLGRSGRVDTLNAPNHMYTRSIHKWTEEEDQKFLDLYYEKVVREASIKPLAKEYL